MKSQVAALYISKLIDLVGDLLTHRRPLEHGDETEQNFTDEGESKLQVMMLKKQAVKNLSCTISKPIRV